MKTIAFLVIGGLAAYAAGAVSNQPFQIFCGFAAVFSFVAAIIYLVKGNLT
jgi:hypothetical protein